MGITLQKFCCNNKTKSFVQINLKVCVVVVVHYKCQRGKRRNDIIIITGNICFTYTGRMGFIPENGEPKWWTFRNVPRVRSDKISELKKKRILPENNHFRMEQRLDFTLYTGITYACDA